MCVIDIGIYIPKNRGISKFKIVSKSLKYWKVFMGTKILVLVLSLHSIQWEFISKKRITLKLFWVSKIYSDLWKFFTFKLIIYCFIKIIMIRDTTCSFSFTRRVIHSNIKNSIPFVSVVRDWTGSWKSQNNSKTPIKASYARVQRKR